MKFIETVLTSPAGLALRVGIILVYAIGLLILVIIRSENYNMATILTAICLFFYTGGAIHMFKVGSVRENIVGLSNWLLRTTGNLGGLFLFFFCIYKLSRGIVSIVYKVRGKN